MLRNMKIDGLSCMLRTSIVDYYLDRKNEENL
jgi:hypothetical protein